ncbi:MAG TPA: TonB-dependent receptor [Vicinamibacterales bacterium]|nr:TonB-dependent receptor [Vicinamibacterales bacterium]
MIHVSRTSAQRWCASGLLIGALLLLTSSATIAQVLYGSIVGVVKDPQGGNVPGATVTIVNKDTNLTREATTDAEGGYTFNNVQAGRYDVKVTLQGFRENVRTGVPVSIGEISRVDLTLEVGTVSETVTVASEAQLLQTDKADVSTELKSQELTSMPLNRFRNYQALINLVPGTTPMAFGNAETDTPARSLATNVNGQVNTNNSTRTDGATNMNIWLPNHNMYISPAETIDTVNISTSSFDAEQGMAGGAAVTVVTKSGTNKFKGSAFEFYNSDKLNATPRFFGSGATPPKLPVKANTYGGTIGGPVRRNAVFFFGSFEGYKREQSLFTFFTVPNEALRRGDFSGAVNTNGSIQNIYDPSTGNTDGTNRTQFANNVIPTNRIDPIALKVLQLFPLPTQPGIGAGGLTNNYRRQEDRTVDRDNFDLKLNWNRTAANQLWGKVSYMNAVVDDLTNYLGPDPNAEGDGGFTKVYQITGGQTWTMTPTLLMDMTFGFSRQKQDVYGPDFNAGNFGLDVLGIPGTNDQGIGDQRYAGYPQFDTGFSAVGNRDGWNPIFRDERTYSLATNVSKIKGRHDVRGGYFVNFMYLDHWQPETGNPRGRFEFRGNVTALNASGAQSSNFYNQYASFLLGLVGTASKSVQNELMTAREWQHALFIRDRWNVSSRLTLDLGLRWEFYPIMTRADGRGIDRLDLDNPDFARRLDVLVAGRGGNPQSSGMEASFDNFAPRVGGIYRLNDKTVLRAGYGLTFNATPWARALRGDNDYPVTIASSSSNPGQWLPYGTFAQGIPILRGPDVSSGRVLLDRTAAVYTPEVGNVDRGEVHTWNVAFERRLPLDVSVDVAYVGAKGIGGYAAVDVNAPQTLGVGDAGRPYASLGRILAINSWGQRLKTDYDSLQIALNKPFTRGLLFKGAYTLSKSMNESDNDGRATLSYNTPSELHRNWAPAGFDRRHNFQLGFAYQLPWQSQGSLGSSPVGWVINDWQINGVFAAFSGTPFTVTASGTSLNTPNNLQTADQAKEFTVLGDIGASGPWFDRTSFTQPTGVRFGNTGRNQFYGPGAYNLDFSVFRMFPVGGAKRLEFRVEAGNVLNHAVYGNPQGSITSGTYGQITGINGNYPERMVRLGLRFTF